MGTEWNDCVSFHYCVVEMERFHLKCSRVNAILQCSTFQNNPERSETVTSPCERGLRRSAVRQQSKKLPEFPVVLSGKLSRLLPNYGGCFPLRANPSPTLMLINIRLHETTSRLYRLLATSISDEVIFERPIF